MHGARGELSVPINPANEIYLHITAASFMNESSSQSDLPQDHKDALEKKEDHGEERTSHRLIRNSISTYARLTGTFAIGLFLARFLGHEDNLGMAAYGLWGVILSSVGIVQVTQMTIRQSLVRELSQAFHTSDH